MTQEILKKIAKARKIDLNFYDHVIAFINPNYTKVHITFAVLETIYGSRSYLCKKEVTLSVCALQKKEEPEWEYTTQGWERIEYIR